VKIVIASIDDAREVLELVGWWGEPR